jgi:hypothetical protein
MTESFPTTLRASTGVRLCAVAIGLVGVLVATRHAHERRMGRLHRFGFP